MNLSYFNYLYRIDNILPKRDHNFENKKPIFNLDTLSTTLLYLKQDNHGQMYSIQFNLCYVYVTVILILIRNTILTTSEF